MRTTMTDEEAEKFEWDRQLKKDEQALKIKDNKEIKPKNKFVVSTIEIDGLPTELGQSARELYNKIVKSDVYRREFMEDFEYWGQLKKDEKKVRGEKDDYSMDIM